MSSTRIRIRGNYRQGSHKYQILVCINRVLKRRNMQTNKRKGIVDKEQARAQDEQVTEQARVESPVVVIGGYKVRVKRIIKYRLLRWSWR